MSTILLETPPVCDARPDESVGELAELIRDEYDEMPGLVLTRPQVCRMFRLDPPTCNAVMDGFVAKGLLVCLPNGSYANCRTRRQAGMR